MPILLFTTPRATIQDGQLPGGFVTADANGWVGVPDMPSALRLANTGQAVLTDTSPVVTTAGRPTTNVLPGMNLLDSTLGKPIWRNAANTQWVDATGATV